MVVTEAASAYVNLTWRLYPTAPLHALPSTLTVTLTSYPPRFPTLSLTLKSLLAQNVRPDGLELWIAEDDLPLLPENVRQLCKHGLSIRSCRNLRSYKKIIPALEQGAKGLLVIADDDVFYPRSWLRELVEEYKVGRKEVLCGRAHRILVDDSGLPLPYVKWEGNVRKGEASNLLFPTGIGGVMYDASAFHHDVTREPIFFELCPTADDVWLFWMAALAGANFRKVGPRRNLLTWNRSQGVGLYNINGTANDGQIKNMIARYGFPPLAQMTMG